jgi:hypothetical protein
MLPLLEGRHYEGRAPFNAMAELLVADRTFCHFAFVKRVLWPPLFIRVLEHAPEHGPNAAVVLLVRAVLQVEANSACEIVIVLIQFGDAPLAPRTLKPPPSAAIVARRRDEIEGALGVVRAALYELDIAVTDSFLPLEVDATFRPKPVALEDAVVLVACRLHLEDADRSAALHT